ncbi:MAG TPA: galactose oxidase-like domain-containing protein, partial [Gemmatimonadales bacterium]|nr:galactose oxidase-like domain-containing protein [Gemmatimonadales bacterium]
DGNVTGGWTDWQEVPDWFSWENQGAGIAVADLTRTGRNDLLVFMIDDAAEQNQAFYKVGAGVGVDGKAAGGWSLWQGLPHWFCWENQGGGIATTVRNGQPQLFVLMVDAPPGQKAGLTRMIPLDQVPARDGRWDLLPFHSGVLAVHAALLPGGKVLFFAGSGSSAARFASPDFANPAKKIWTSVVWDPTVAGPDNFFHPKILFAADHRPFDFFCGGDSYLADGRLLSAGGTIGYNPFRGRNDACAFDPVTQQWTFVNPMQHGRWYPTLITLSDGRVLAATGLTEAFDEPHNETLEIYDPATNHWGLHTFVPDFPGLPLYAHLFLMADGRVFFDGGRMDDELAVNPCIIDLTEHPLHTEPVPGLAGGGMRNQSASVILPPAQDQKVMVMGGGPAGKPNKTDAIDDVDLVDLRGAQPHFEAVEPLCFPRLHLNAVLLPDRTVMVTGGSLKQEDQPLARLQAEIFDPATASWTPVAKSQVARLYHSTALLLPDGRVVAAGGNPEGGTHIPWDQDPEEEMRLELFSPPYLFRGPRPTIGAVATEWTYGQTVSIPSPQAGNLRWAHLIRPCVTTHSFDGSQRLVDLPIASQAGGVVKVTVTASRNVAPPGWYMLFLVSQDGVPSVASWVHLG